MGCSLRQVDRAATSNPRAALFEVSVHVAPTFSPARFGLSDSRQLGVQLQVSNVEPKPLNLQRACPGSSPSHPLSTSTSATAAAGLVAALEGPRRVGCRPGRDAVPRPARSSRRGGGAPYRPYARARATPAARVGRARLKGDRYLRRTRGLAEDTRVDRLYATRSGALLRRAGSGTSAARSSAARRDAVIVFTVPMAHFRGIPRPYAAVRSAGRLLRRRRADEPAEFGGMDTASTTTTAPIRPSTTSSFPSSRAICGSRARRAPGRDHLLAGRSRALPAAPVEKENDVFFYGFGTSSGASGWPRSSASRAGDGPVDRLRPRRPDFQGDIGAPGCSATPVQRLRSAISAAGQPQHHAATACDRPCFLDPPSVRAGACGRAIVSSRHAGDRPPVRALQRAPSSSRCAIRLSRRRASLDDPAEAEAMGVRARSASSTSTRTAQGAGGRSRRSASGRPDASASGEPRAARHGPHPCDADHAGTCALRNQATARPIPSRSGPSPGTRRAPRHATCRACGGAGRSASIVSQRSRPSKPLASAISSASSRIEISSPVPTLTGSPPS